MKTRGKMLTILALFGAYQLSANGQSLQATVDITPDTLYLGSDGRWVTCDVRLPEPYDVADVDIGTLHLAGQLQTAGSSTGQAGNVLTVKFERWEVKEIVAPFAPGEVELTLTGQLRDGTEFEGSDTIRVSTGEEEQYTITPSAGPNGSISPASPMTVTHGSNQEFIAEPDLGYEVDAWSVDGTVPQTGGTTYTLSNIQADHTVHVTFSQLEYTVTPSAGPNGSISPAGPVTIAYGGSQGFTAMPDVGHEVDAWSVDGTVVQTGGTAYTLSNIQADHTVHVTFSQLEYTVTPSAGPNGSISPAGPVTIAYGGSQALTAMPDVGYEVDAWYLDGSTAQNGGTNYTLSNIQADHTVQVTFKQIQYTITPSADPSGSIAPVSPMTVQAGGSQEFTAQPAIGNGVDTWYLDDNAVQTGGTNYTLSNLQASHTVHVTFKPIQYTITASAGPHGSIYPDGPATVQAGGSQDFTAEPDFGYEVDTWYLDDNADQIGGTSYTLFNIQDNHEVRVTFKQPLSQSLGSIDFDDEKEFATHIIHNNVIEPGDPEKTRIHVERVIGLDPDPEGMMWMHNLKDVDPTSPNYLQMVNARVKGFFYGTNADEILIRFKYLFSTDKPGVEMIIYLSDTPELLDLDDPRREEHCFEVARLPVPPVGRPGSLGSGRFGVFEKIVWTGSLNLTEGTWIELELVEPEISNSVLIDGWNPAVQCYGICLDINWDNLIDVADFLKVIGECGHVAVDDRACLEGVFSVDGTVDSFDVASWDWALNSEDRLLNFCVVPLVHEGTTTGTTASPSLASVGASASLPTSLSDLLIAGKRGASDAPAKLKDRLYAFARDGQCMEWSTPALERCNTRLVQGAASEIYQVNSEIGVLRLNGQTDVVIPPGAIQLAGVQEPRYNQPATVYIGIQSKGSDSFGRPILDAAFDADYAYVVPVVVHVDGRDPYTAAAKLQLLGQASPPYQVVRLYDDPPLAGDNQYHDALREIELDSAGNVYVLNVHSLNESDILWRYKPDGTVERLDLGRPDSPNYLATPMAMYASRTTEMLYLASGRLNPASLDSAVLYGFSTSAALTLERSITINGMHLVTAITEEPGAQSLWVVGINMAYVPEYPSPFGLPFYRPCLAEVPVGSRTVQATSLFHPYSHDLALPTSVLWTSSTAAPCLPTDFSTHNDWVALGRPACWCNPYQCDGDVDGATEGLAKYRVSLYDFNAVVNNWQKTIDDPTLDPCADIDHRSAGPMQYRVYVDDMNTILTNWKKTDVDLPGDCPRQE